MASARKDGTASDTSEIDIFSKTHEYKGATLLALQSPEIIEPLRTFQTRSDDVFTVCFPKSDDVETITPDYEAISKWESPRVIATHILEEFCPEHIKKRSKIIYFCRNPKDLCVSYFKFICSTLPEEMERWKGILPFFLSDKMYHGGWFRHVKGWWALQDELNILSCKYEDFHKDLRGSIKRVADFLERPLSDEKLDKMVELTEMKGMQKTYQQIEENMAGEGLLITRLFGKFPYLRKRKVGAWKDEFTVAENEYFDKIYKENMGYMAYSGLEFQFEL